MKLTKISSAVIAICFVGSSMAATTGELTITGTVIDKTCDIAPSTSGISSITLDNIAKGSLTTAGDFSLSKDFSIDVTGCDAGNIKVRWSAPTVSNMDIATGTLKNIETESPASNVNVVIFNRGGSQIKMGDSANNSTSVAISETGTAQLDYSLGYYATGKADKGGVKAIAKYEVTYE